MYVLKNLTDHGLSCEPEWYLPAGGYMVYPPEKVGYDDLDRPERFPYHIQQHINAGRIKKFYVQPLSEDWPQWAYIEVAKLEEWKLLRGNDRRPEGRTYKQIKDFREYMGEKLPHKDPVILYIGNELGITWLQKVSGKMWSRVLLPGLTDIAEKNNTKLSYAVKNRYASTRVELKLYFSWRGPHHVKPVGWDDTERVVKEHTRYYPPTLGDLPVKRLKRKEGK